MIAQNVNPFPGAIYYLSSPGNGAESVFHGPKPFTTSSFQHAGHALVCGNSDIADLLLF
jgi:hypothetical protein